MSEAREIGRHWVLENKATIPGYCGAIFAGSSLQWPKHMDWPLGPDLDIFLYQINPVGPLTTRRVACKGIVLDASCHDFKDHCRNSAISIYQRQGFTPKDFVMVKSHALGRGRQWMKAGAKSR